MGKRGSQVALTLIFALFGLMLAMQFRARPPISGPLQYQRSEELALLLKVAEEDRDKLREEVAELRDQLADMQSVEDQVRVLQEELSKAMVLAGTAEVRGPGISLELSDSKTPSQPGQDPNLFVVHDKDLLEVVNEVFAAGAEAVSINGQRIVATTEITCAGNVIMINGVRQAPPFLILAIGDPATLEGGLKMRGGLIDNLTFWHLEVKLKAEEEITIPAYGGSLSFKYARPVRKESK
ncbi:MAG: DUF881 domain-containing protein [Bacillota bacterium]|jgi:uncharacterized protein YlxW (UPF0749 family)